MKPTPRRLLGVTAALVLATANSVAGQSAPAGPAGEVDLNFMHVTYSAATEPGLRTLIANFEAANPGIKVELQMVPGEQYNQVFNTAVQAGSPPDVAFHYQLGKLWKDGLLLPIEDWVPKAVIDDFYPSLTASGLGVGMPTLASVRGMYYNTDIFTAAGITGPPATWDEFRADLEKIKAARPDVVPFGYDGTDLEGDASFAYFLWGAGGDFLDSQGNWTFNTPQGVEALTFLKQLYDDGLMEPEALTVNRDEQQKRFAQGRTAMIASGSYIEPQIVKYGNGIHFDFSSIPVKAGVGGANMVVADYLVVPKATQHLEEVKKFVQAFYDDPQYVSYVTGEGFLSGRKSLASAIATTDSLKKFSALVETGKSMPRQDPRYQEVSQLIKAAVQKALLGQMSPQAALDELNQKANAVAGG